MSTEKIHRPAPDVRKQQLRAGRGEQSRTMANPVLTDLQTTANASGATQGLVNLQLQANTSASARGVSALQQRANGVVAQLSRGSESDSYSDSYSYSYSDSGSWTDDGYSSDEDSYSYSGSSGESSESYSDSSLDGSVSEFTPAQGNLAYGFAQKGPKRRMLSSFFKKMRPTRFGGPTKSDRKKALAHASDVRANQANLMEQHPGYGKGRKRAELLNTTANVADGVALGASVVKAVPAANIAAPAAEVVGAGATLTSGLTRSAAGRRRRGAAEHLADAAEAGDDQRGESALSTIEDLQGRREMAVGAATLTFVPFAARAAGESHDQMHADETAGAQAEFAYKSVQAAQNTDDSEDTSSGPYESDTESHDTSSDDETSASYSYDSYSE